MLDKLRDFSREQAGGRAPKAIVLTQARLNAVSSRGFKIARYADASFRKSTASHSG
jgi:hypothetical protein